MLSEVREEGRAQPPLVPRNWVLLAVALAALITGVLQLARVIELPLGVLASGGGSILSSPSVQSFMQSVGYLGLFVLMALESASAPIPSELVLPFAGFLVHQGTMNFWIVLVVSTAASLAGALVDYYIAYWLGRPFVLRMLKLFRVGAGSLERAEGWFERSGRWTVFAARFVPVLRSLISLPAGLFEMDLKDFVLLTAVGCLGWSAALVYAGYVIGDVGSSLSTSPVLADMVAVGGVLAGALYIAYYAAGRKRS